MKNLNFFLFSPHFLASHIETFTHVLTGGQGMSKMFQINNAGQNFVRKQAGIQLAKIAGVVALFAGVNEAFNPGEGSIDPRSTKFGKVKVGAGYNDVTGGFAPFVTFMSRIATGTSIGATGKKTDLSSGKFGKSTKMDVVERYFRGKLSPLVGTIANFAFYDGEDIMGKDMTPTRTVGNLITPIPVSSAVDIINEDDAEEYIASQLLDILGSASSKYNN